MPSLPPPASHFSSVVSQATAMQSVHARLLSTTSLVEAESTEDVVTVDDLRSLSSSTASSTAQSRSKCQSCAQLETDFAGAVLFIESYQGPHRILTQSESSLKKDLYAFYQQATVGPCPTTTPPIGLSKLELAKREKWQKLGSMTRQEAMRCYTTILDNLVDDWRRMASVRNSSMRASDAFTGQLPSEAGSAMLNRAEMPTSMFERLPHIYDELKELQDRVEDEAKKRDELETHLLHFTRDNRDIFDEQIEQTKQICNNLVALVKNLEDDVVQYSTDLQRLAMRQQLVAQAENSVLLAVETRVRHVFVIVQGWMQNRSIRTTLVVLIALRAWCFLRRRRLPQFLAQILIRWLTKVSSLDGKNAPQLATSRR